MNATALPTSLQAQTLLAARILLAMLFLLNGIAKLTAFPVFVAYIASKGIPFPEACNVIATILELGGAFMLIVGWRTREAALVLAVYTLLLAFGFHDFWNLQAAQAVAQKNHFLKNLSIIGGFLVLAASGPGAWSVDMRAKRGTEVRMNSLKT